MRSAVGQLGDPSRDVISANFCKSAAMRIGERYKVKCDPLTLDGSELQFVGRLKYLGVQFVAELTCSVENVRVKCYRTFNARSSIRDGHITAGVVRFSFFFWLRVLDRA